MLTICLIYQLCLLLSNLRIREFVKPLDLETFEKIIWQNTSRHYPEEA